MWWWSRHSRCCAWCVAEYVSTDIDSHDGCAYTVTIRIIVLARLANDTDHASITHDAAAVADVRAACRDGKGLISRSVRFLLVQELS